MEELISGLLRPLNMPEERFEEWKQEMLTYVALGDNASLLNGISEYGSMGGDIVQFEPIYQSVASGGEVSIQGGAFSSPGAAPSTAPVGESNTPRNNRYNTPASTPVSPTSASDTATPTGTTPPSSDASTIPTNATAADTLATDLLASQGPPTGAGPVEGPKFIGVDQTEFGEGETQPTYYEGMERTAWLSMSESQAIALKRQMFDAGLYGDTPEQELFLGMAMATEADRDALYTLMDEANNNRLATYEEALKQRLAYGGTNDVLGDSDRTDLVDQGLSFDQQMRTFADNNGLSLTDDWIQNKFEQVLAGKTSIAQIQQNLREKYVANSFPAWRDDILNGENVSDIAAPYRNRMASLLELPDDAIDVNNPLLRQALQGVGGDGKPSYMPLWEFERMVKQDPRWENTKNGRDEIMSLSMRVLQDFGFQP